MRRIAWLWAGVIVAACGGGSEPSEDDAAGGTGGSGGGGGSATLPYEVVVCEDTLVAEPGADVCAVTAGDDRLLVVGDVLQPGRVIEGGAVLVEDGVIACVGCDCLAAAAGATTVVCPDAAVSPGLINAHDHVGWMNGRPWVASDNGVDPALRWEHRHDWRRGKRNHPEISVDGGGASLEEKIGGEVRFALSGATAIFGSGDLGGLLRDLDGTGDGDNGLGQPGAKYDTFPLGDSDGTQLEDGCSGYDPAGPAADYFDSHAPHVAEGIDAVAQNEFHCLTGQGAGSSDILDGRTAIVHGIGLTPTEIDHMASEGMKLIWSPRSNLSLYGDTAPVTLHHRLGVTIALGTDWLPSGSMNMLRELACAADFNRDFLGGYFDEHDLWQMATVGAARALAFDDVTGQLLAGRAADLAIFQNGDRQHYAAVVGAELADVALVVRGGEVLSGNAAVVEALESGCDPLDVCGSPKRVCVARDTGQTLAAIESQASYPLFFCGVPDDEPTCLPARTLPADSVEASTLYPGMSTPDDRDGDGIADEADNCATIFNPVRPLDGGSQGDHDGDGAGDACDDCPLDPADGCEPLDPADLDGDGVPNVDDLCPGVADPDQADGDGDGKGDACDACPEVANPGPAACPGKTTSIYALQDPTDPDHPAVGTRVQIACVITAVGPTAVWCQDPLSGPLSGISIFVGADATYAGTNQAVALHDDVLIDADYAEYFGVTQLEAPVFTFVGQGAPLPPEVIADPAAIATGGPLAEAYEGVLVQIESITVVDENPDAPNDYDEFAVTGDLRIDDYAMDGGGTGGQLDNTFPVGTPFTSIVGVSHYSFDNHKLLPRSPADLTP